VRTPEDLIDVLFARLVRDLSWGIAALEAVIVLGRLPQALRGQCHPLLVLGPLAAMAISGTGASVLAFARVRPRTSDRVFALCVGSLAVVFGAMSAWVAEPSRLFVFVILLVMAGLFQRHRGLYGATLAVTLAALAFGWHRTPPPPGAAIIAVSIFFAAGIAGFLAHHLVNSMVRRLIRSLRRVRAARREIATLQGFIPICAHCKKVRNDRGYWEQVETYIAARTAAAFSHGICPQCAEAFFPNHKAAER
jgi:hypothetical protein